MKRLISFFICAAMLISIVPATVFAASTTLNFETELAEDLKSLGIFKGVSDTDFALDRAPTRTEAIIMLIRVLGKESEALSRGGKHPFTDVPAWADMYVGYAYENKLTNGVSETRFGSDSEASSAMYITFVLRALGYSDADNADFTWYNPYALAKTAGIMTGSPNTVKFLRGDVVLVSYAALNAKLKGSDRTLSEKLIDAGVFTKEKFEEVYDKNILVKENESKNMTAEQVYEACSPAVFYIEVCDKKGNAFASGSGFFINSNGTAVTNYHVIEDAYSATITSSESGKEFKITGVYDYDEKNDWAVIKVEGTGFPYLEIEEKAVNGGSTVYAIGSPLGLQNTISQGLVSNVDRELDGVSYIQTSAAISSGSSGGALINQNGKVIGITSAGFSDGQNLNLALPISVINNYNGSKLTDLATIATGTAPKPGAQTTTSENTRSAFAALKKWISDNVNYQSGSTLCYREIYEEDGYTEDCRVYVSEPSGSVCVSYGYINDEGYSVIAITGFDDKTPEVLMTYSYYDSVSDYKATTEGVVWVDKSDFRKGMTVEFDEYNGTKKERESDEEIASYIIYDNMNFIKVIFDEIPGYDIADVGFVNMK